MACFHDRRFFSLGYNEKKCDSSTSSRVSSRTGVAQGDCEVERERWSRVRASKQASSIQGAATGNTDKANVPPVLAGAGGPYPQANSLIEGAARVAEHYFRAAEQNGSCGIEPHEPHQREHRWCLVGVFGTPVRTDGRR